MKKILLFSILLCSLVFSGCKNNEGIIDNNPSEITSEVFVADDPDVEASKELESFELNTDTQELNNIDGKYAWQIQAIYDNRDIWKLSDEDNVDSDWYCDYAITDFDQDGYLEVCKCVQYNNGPVTTIWIYEVSEDGTIVELESELDDPDVDYKSVCYPDIKYRPYANYIEEDGEYKYIFYDCRSYGLTGGVFFDFGYLVIRDNKVDYDIVCTMFSDAEDNWLYYDGEGNEINEEEFNNLQDNYSGDFEGSHKIYWFTDDMIDISCIKKSFECFNELIIPTRNR